MKYKMVSDDDMLMHTILSKHAVAFSSLFFPKSGIGAYILCLLGLLLGAEDPDSTAPLQ